MPVSSNPFVRARDALRNGRLFRRVIPNLLHDIRWGAYLGGSIPSPFPELGAFRTESSDWADLEKLFAHPDARPRPDDVIVDAGCGKGRTLAFFARLTRGRNRVVGIEINPVVAQAARRRFRREKRIEVLTGDAVELLPPETTLLYLSNPFDEAIMRRLVARIHAIPGALDRLRVVYHHDQSTLPFVERGWTVEPLSPEVRMHSSLLRPPPVRA